jgi:hypothetical protein
LAARRGLKWKGCQCFPDVEKVVPLPLSFCIGGSLHCWLWREGGERPRAIAKKRPCVTSSPTTSDDGSHEKYVDGMLI